MKLVCQLSKLMRKYFGDKRGAIAEICRETGLKRSQVTPLMNNSAQLVSLEVLVRICLYLHRKHGVPLSDLPGVLFAFEATDFWSLFEKSRVQISVGMRSDTASVDYRWINSYDAHLLATFITEWSKLGHERMAILDLHFVPGFSPTHDAQATFSNAQAIYEKFRAWPGGADRTDALVSIGDTKSNPLSECIIARAFGTHAFEEQRNVMRPQQRRVPFFFCNRPEDPYPPSCFGGLHLAHSQRNSQPGIYYETQAGWKHCPTTSDGTEDAAMIFYCYRPHQRTVELLLAGFSERAAASIAADLPTCTKQIWPPQYQQSDLKIGAYIIRYQFDVPVVEKPNGEELLGVPTAREFIRLPESVIARRVAA